MADDSGPLMAYMAVIATVAMVAWGITQWDPSGPQLVGWSALQGVMSNPLGTLGAFSENWANQRTCSGEPLGVIGCWFNNLVNLLVGVATGLVSVLMWIIGTLITVGTALFGVMTLTFSPPLPVFVQVALWLFTAPFWILVVLRILTLLRGD